jgi:hypothetical protein
MLVRYLKSLVESPFLHEKFLGGGDEETKVFLSMVGTTASAMCASLVYRWIARQLIPDALPTYVTHGTFGSHLDLVEKWRLAKLYKKYYDVIKDDEVRRMMWEVSGVTKDYFLTEPYEALTQDPTELYCRVIAGGKFAEWNKLTSDGHLTVLFQSIERAVTKAFGAEQELYELLHEVMDYPTLSNQSRDFYALVSIKSLTFGHAIGLRYEHISGKVHWFDPNVGHFVFPSWSKTIQALQAYWRILWMDETPEGSVYPAGAQFRQWMLVQYRRLPKDKDLADFLWDTSELKL